MSGTSVDSIDAASVEVEGEPGDYSITLVSFVSVPWEPGLRSVILNSCHKDVSLQQVTALNYLVGESFAEACIFAANEARWDLSSVDAVASHGQTIWHQPQPFTFPVSAYASIGTMQIGEPSVIAARTGCTVVADFRAADMAVGGQGAPLVPFADYALFASSSQTRAIQNIGGIGNVTYLRANGGLDDVIAFDTGPGNVLLDGITRLTLGRQYDEGGAIASQGMVCRPLLENWLAHPFFTLKPPRTTGRELFGADMAARMVQEGRDRKLSNSDLLATAAALTAESIALAYHTFLDPISAIECVVLGGGGTHNAALVSMLIAALAPARVTNHEEFGLNSDAKEAVAFALLAYATLHGRPSNVPSATGAYSPAILGKVVRPYSTNPAKSRQILDISRAAAYNKKSVEPGPRRG
jgi:anhydro-N-acetylmuramic acid kinase